MNPKRQQNVQSGRRRAACPAVGLALILLGLGGWTPFRVAASPLAPGMFEARHQHASGYDQQNFSLWSPFATGGGGRIAPDKGQVIDYGNLGLTTEPLFDAPGQALVMAGFVHTAPYHAIGNAVNTLGLERNRDTRVHQRVHDDVPVFTDDGALDDPILLAAQARRLGIKK